jgi:hypothetical protein
MIDFHNLYKIQYEFNRGFALHYFLLYSIVYGLEVKNSYEFGAGLSTKVILEALKETGGIHTSCSKSPREEICNGVINSNPKWIHNQMLSDDAIKLLRKDDIFDFVLHDGSHKGIVVMKDLQVIVSHMKQFSILLIHDTQHSHLGSSMRSGVVKGLREVEHSIVTLPYGCGLTIVRIEGNKHNGKVEITRIKKGSKHTTVPI